MAPHGDESGAPPREPTEPKDDVGWLPPPILRESLPRLLLDAPPMVPDLALLSPPRCEKEREAGGGEDVEEPAWWR